MKNDSGMVEQYMALALQPTMRGAQQRADIQRNLDHIAELARASVWLSSIDLPVRLVTVPEGALQGFTDEVFDWDHVHYVKTMAIDLPGPETEFLGDLARSLDTFIIAQAKAKHPEFPERFFNCAFVIDRRGKLIHTHYKMQVFAREHSTVPHDVWDRWVELYGEGLDAFYPVVDTEIGRIGCLVCMEGSYPETARGLAMNGAEILYRPSYPEPYVSNGLWEIQNRARALDNTMYVIAPNPGSYYLSPKTEIPLDVVGGNSMIVDYQGRVISNHQSGGAASYAGAIIDIEALRQYRTRSLWGNWLKDLRTEQYRLIYDRPIYEKNRCLKRPPLKHAENDKVVRAATQRLVDRGVWKLPAYMKEKPAAGAAPKKRELADTEADE
jgi:predicted amidohydrolase